ncbi:MAG: glycosyltransferase [Candidatus Competibacter denitrificans]
MKPNEIKQDNTIYPSFVVFSDDWGEHPSSSQHLFKHIALNHKVLWVNTIGMRNPKLTWSDFNKIIKKIKKMFGSLNVQSQQQSGNIFLHVCQPFMLPFNWSTLVRKFNKYSVQQAIQRNNCHLDLTNSVFVATVPNACDYIDILVNSKAVYYCVDDFTQWPGLNHRLVREMEAQLIERSEILVATSHKLYHKLHTYGKPTYLLTHGVDRALFLNNPSTEHTCLSNIQKPRIGYFGLIDERSDQNLLVAIASSMPDFSFVMTGPVVADVSRLKACSNIYFTGPVAYTDLPSLVKGLDILFIPYLVNEFTDSISPLKLKEYLMTGKPVVTTPLAEAKSFSQYLMTASSVEEWKITLMKSLKQAQSSKFELIIKAMEGDLWENKAKIFLDICVQENVK